jgi:hypothetical protein
MANACSNKEKANARGSEKMKHIGEQFEVEECAHNEDARQVQMEGGWGEEGRRMHGCRRCIFVEKDTGGGVQEVE